MNANTFGFGNLEQYGVPDVMTADGPAGVRFWPQCGVNTTAFPCATALACTWDTELIAQVGEAAALEAKENNIGGTGDQHPQKPALRQEL